MPLRTVASAGSSCYAQDLIGRGVADPDSALRVERQTVDFGALDALLVQQLAVARVEPQDVPSIGFGDAERAVAFVPEHAV